MLIQCAGNYCPGQIERHSFMKMNITRTTGAIALVASAALVLAGCSSGGGGESSGGESGGEASTGPLKIATLLPQTGSLDFLRPPVEAGIALALADIEAAGGVLDQPVEVVANANEGDGSDITVVEKGAQEVIDSGAAFVMGAMSTSRSQHVYKDITGAGILMGSPSNTGDVMTGVSPFYFRTAPPDSVQGSVLAQLILDDGNEKVGFLTFNDVYGLGLRDTIEGLVTDGGAEVVYGGKVEGNEFPVEQTSFASEVTALKASGAEAIVVITFDQVEQIIPELKAQGVDLSKVYLVDGSLKNFESLEPGLLAGAQGTKPGFEVDADFLQALKDAYQEEYGSELADLTYAPEAYDLLTIVALAAEKAGATDAASIQAQLAAVTGADGGEECASFADCKALIADGKDIRYVTKAGVGPLNENNDPSTAWIGIYSYGTDSNEPVFVRSEEGTI